MAIVTNVDSALDARAHPLRDQLDQLRDAIVSVSPQIVELWKWNAPSYKVKGDDLLTFMLRRDDQLLVVIHHIAAPAVQSPLFTVNPKDARRLIWVTADDDLNAVATELSRIVGQLVVASTKS
jgi:hypothetical protein